MNKVPLDWKPMCLDAICTFGSGAGFPERYQGREQGDHPFIKVSDFEIPGNERFIRSAANWVTAGELKAIKARLHPENSVVFAKVGAALRLNRRRLLTIPTAIDNNLMSALPNSSVVTPNFLYLLLDNIDFGQWAQETSMPSVNQGTLEKIPVLLPPLSEQRYIADILATWDKALEALDGQIDRKERVADYLRETLTSGTRRLDGSSRAWPIVKLGDVARHLTVRNGSRYGRERVMGVTKAEGLVPMKEHVIAADIARYLVLPPQAFAYNPMRINIGSIVMSEAGENVIVSPDYVVFACHAERCHPRFLNHLRRTRAWQDFMTIAGNGSVRIRIYYDDLANFEFHLPPLADQMQIIAVLDDAECELAVLRRERRGREMQRDALASQLLTGRLRMPEAERLAVAAG